MKQFIELTCALTKGLVSFDINEVLYIRDMNGYCQRLEEDGKTQITFTDKHYILNVVESYQEVMDKLR